METYKKRCLRRQGEPPWKLGTAALCLSFLESNHSGILKPLYIYFQQPLGKMSLYCSAVLCTSPCIGIGRSPSQRRMRFDL